MSKGGVITGWGTALPDGIVTNHDWIVERTGIHERRWSDRGPGDLGAEAGRKAMDMAGLGPDDIDLMILATCSPEIGRAS